MLIDNLEKILQIKIVYFGPAMSGKTTSLKKLFNHFGKGDQLESIESTVGRTLFFDFGTVQFQNEEWLLKILFYSTTGQDFYAGTRPTVLRGIDGLIFVADSQMHAYKRNVASWNELESYFEPAFFKELPKVVALNKQDLTDKFATSIFLNDIDYNEYKNIEWKYTIALSFEGILECFEELLRLIFLELYKQQLQIERNSN
ncbi:MAG: hypothetical protein GF317_12630 [Candidatus Lokiarchaeota archaeon]|nr:hypothetical protein [Candidatus Lokiarchaeota archaeon]MBD3200493.1 hypothetical protein [Candidatus Lokiarchaeota archaeon]